jgi:microcystin degradation protein MlrC
VPIDGTLEFLGPYQPHDTVAVVRFGQDNRLILTPVLDQVTDPGILRDLKIPLQACDLILIKSRVHFWRGFVEDGLAKAVFQVDAPGLGPADVSTIPYKFGPRTLYPIDRNAKKLQ